MTGMALNEINHWFGHHPFNSPATRSHPVARLHAAILGGSPQGGELGDFNVTYKMKN